MTQKTISIPEDVYNILKAKKKPNEKFADLLLRLSGEFSSTNNDIPIEHFFGVFDDESDEWDEIEKKLYSARNIIRDRPIPK